MNTRAASLAGSSSSSPPSQGQPDAGGSPTPTPPPTTTTPPPPPPEEGTCGNPKCSGLGGVCGCKGTGAETTLMGCKDGQCACNDVAFPDEGACGVTADKEALKQLFIANCACQ